MNELTDHWTRLQELFGEMVGLAPAEREDVLKGRCGSDPDLRAELDALLAADGAADRILRGAVGNAAASLATTTSLLKPDSRLGPWRIIREMARGGMGTVYLAERADGQFSGQVAIKLVHPGPALERLTRRFRTERQILASLRHPNIAHLLDGGTTDDGTPYVVMEYVDGEPITDWCDSRFLPVVDRLRLFLTVCRAVDHAHRNLVVHRDLKPGNIFVTEDGVAKLLDFGIAKLLAGDSSDAGGEDTTGVAFLTPSYASPEQLRGGPVTTATDVYSLGVVLYELLSGQRPYRVAGLSAAEVERVVATTEPPRPSTLGQELAVPSRSRSTSPERLRRQLAGDLDTIILMALRKEPDRRYASVGHLAEDIERYLDGLPVRARPDTLSYRSRKFLSRHRAGMAALAGLLALSVIYLVRIGRERERTQNEARKAQQVATFLSEVFSVADPAETLGADLTARELLERGAARVDRELAGQPRSQATLLEAIGGVYYGLGLYREATPVLERALRLRSGPGGGSSLDLAGAEFTLARLLASKGELPRAESLHRAALARRNTALEEDDPDRITSLIGLGGVQEQQGKLPEAETALREAVAAARQTSEGDPEILADALDALSRLRRHQGDDRESERLAREALALLSLRLGPEHPRSLRTAAELADLFAKSGNFRASDSAFRVVTAIGRRVLGPGHPAMATYLRQHAWTLLDMGEYQRADSVAQEVLALHRARLGGSHPEVAADLRVLGNTRFARVQLEDAERLYRQALAIDQRHFAEDHPAVRSDLVVLAGTLAERGRPDTALVITRHLAALVRRAGAEHPDLLTLLNNEGVILQHLGRLGEADSVMHVALDLARRLVGEANPNLIFLRANLTIVGLMRDQPLAGSILGPEAVAVVRREVGERSRHVAAVLFAVGRAQVALGRPVEGAASIREAEQMIAGFAPGYWLLGWAHATLVAALAAQGRWEEAERELRRTEDALRASPPPGPVYREDARRQVDEAYRKAGHPPPHRP